MAIPNTAIASKTATTSAAVNADVLAAAAKQSPLINANQVQNQGSDGSSQDKKPRPGFEGPSPNIPDVSKPGADSLYPKSAPDEAKVNELMGRVSNADAFKQLAGIVTGSTTGSSAVDQITALTATGGLMAGPGAPSPFDQGFGSQPNVDANMVPVGNPMAAFQSASVYGPLAAAADASQSQSQKGIASQGKGAISDALLDRAVAEANAEAEARKKAEEEKTKAENPLTSAWGAKDSPDGVKADKGRAEKAIDTVKKILSYFGFNPTSEEVNEGVKNVVGLDRAGGDALKPETQTEEQYNKDSGRSFTSTSTLFNQIIASNAGKPASQGGSGDATPVDNGGISQVVNNVSIVAKSASVQGQKLFGQPSGDAIGENVSGGNKGLDVFGKSNGAGVTNPGGEGGIPSGDPRYQQDPANALPGNKPAPTLQSPVGTQENQSSSVSTTLAAGARNLTLTGTALINGTGNALDNVINGNSAANGLRGEAGNDSLDGKVGNDLLDGGAGRDQLIGGSGADRFRFATAGAFGTAQADSITDFSRSEGDRIEVSRSAFGLAAGATLSFQTVNNDAELTRALGSSSLLVQDLRDGTILFNQNGSAAGVGQGGVFAVVSQGLALQTNDFALGA
jgi:Ca2+-binding RTX toxin-like protein